MEIIYDKGGKEIKDGDNVDWNGICFNVQEQGGRLYLKRFGHTPFTPLTAEFAKRNLIKF